jgi:hypothetical protein
MRSTDQRASGQYARVHEGERGRAAVTVTLTADQLIAVTNALNEVCNVVRELNDDDEFVARIGATRDVVLQLLAEFRALIETSNVFPE